MAEQKEPIRRRVALKIIKLGMDTKSVVARFEAERQALALMNHPNIAKVLDAGSTESGRPYFVMDLVPGLPITKYCDRNRLNIEQRLNLFILICDAVQHAHQKGIIHRDLKPSNIIVTMHDSEPVPKIIDFGIAKATNQRLTEKTLFTQHGQFIGTPAYMSPEQAQLSDWDVDTRTDIYSLGILLYELLTGTVPFSEEQLRKVSHIQMQKIIREEEPTKPSTKLSTLGGALTDIAKWHNSTPESLPKLIRGDLDWIVMKALEKNRTRRYDTASALGMDVRHHLDNEPVQAAAPSITYKLCKFTKRHRVSVLTGLIVVAASLIFAVISAIYAIETDRAKQETTALLAGSYVEQAQTLCEQGHVGRGMLWLAESLRTAPDGSSDLDQAIRTSMAAWSRQTHKLRTVVRYPTSIKAVAFGPDGSRILATCWDGTARLCDSTTGQPIGKSLPHGAEISAAAFSPDGMWIATGGRDGSARLWNSSTLEPVDEAVRHGQDPLIRVLFTLDGTRLITSTRDSVRFWDSRTGEPIDESFQIEDVRIRAVARCPDGIRALVTTGRHAYQLFDVASGEPIGPPLDQGRTAYAVAISPDGKRFVTGNDLGTIRMWDAVTGPQALEPMSHGGTIFTLAFTPDGSRIASGGASRMARLWDVASGVQIGSPMRQRSTVTTVAFSPDGTRLVTGNQDGVVQQWDLVRNRHVGETVGQQDETLRGATFARGGLWVLTQTEDRVQFKDADTGKLIGEPFSSTKAVRFRALSPDGSRLVTDSGEDVLSVWDVMIGKLVGELFHPSSRKVVFSPDGSRILSGASNKIARMWNALTLKCLGELRQHQSVVSGVAFSPDGSRFLTGSFDGTTQLWETTTLEPVGKPLVHQSEVQSLTFSLDGTRILIGFADGTVRLWHAGTLEPIGTPLQHVELVSGVAFVPSGSQLLASSIDGTARLWDSATLKPVGPPLEHNPSWSNLAISPDDSRILFYRLRGAKVWQAPPRPLVGDSERIVCWVQVVTGMELDSTGGINVLDASIWEERRQRLEKLGGPPLTNLPLPGHGSNGGSEVQK